MPLLKEMIPKIYNDLLGNIGERTVSYESFATCGDCAMKCATKASQPFNQDLKCCTFFPKLPNYLVGSIISAEGTNIGKTRILGLIERKTGVDPSGLFPPKKYQFLYSGGLGSFGNSRSLVCPYFDLTSKSCSIWDNRDSVCSTWFCKHVSGDAGKLFWDKFRDYLGYQEWMLSSYAATNLGLPRGTFNQFIKNTDLWLTARDMDDLPPTDEEYLQAWGVWAGRELEFFTQAYEIICKLSSSSMKQILGQLGVEYENELHRLIDRAFTVPDDLVLQKCDSEKSGKVIKLDEINCDHQLPLDVLKYLDGNKTISEITSEISLEENITIEKDLFLPLIHYGIVKKRN